ncbi:Methylated-DNA--protein-cysteine methyltransferase [Thalassocella blandensis]|nr:Methylated-DNA--protein-cysteine methyltransferase [Thalassocella blandensis]
MRLLCAEFKSQENELHIETQRQIEQYLLRERLEFDLPIKLVGTEFQIAVWQALQKIEYGKTANYLQLATLLGCESSVRAVANANGANALALVVPCHRIIGSNGELVGYGGGLNIKQRLLVLEQPDLFGG